MITLLRPVNGKLTRVVLCATCQDTKLCPCRTTFDDHPCWDCRDGVPE